MAVADIAESSPVETNMAPDVDQPGQAESADGTGLRLNLISAGQHPIARNEAQDTLIQYTISQITILFFAAIWFCRWPTLWKSLHLSPMNSEATLVTQSVCILAIGALIAGVAGTVLALLPALLLRPIFKRKHPVKLFELNTSTETAMSIVLNGLALIPGTELIKIDTATGVIEAQRTRGYPKLQLSITVQPLDDKKCSIRFACDTIGDITTPTGFYRITPYFAIEQSAMVDKAVNAVESVLTLKLHMEPSMIAVSGLSRKSYAYRNSSIIGVAVISTGIGLLAFCGLSSENLQFQQIEGAEFFSYKQPDIGLRYAERAIAIDKTGDYYGHELKARCLHDLKNFPDALTECELACTLDRAKIISLRHFKSTILHKLGRFEEADQTDTQNLKDEKLTGWQRALTLNNLAWSNALRGNHEIAIDQSNKAIVLLPGLKNLYGTRGLAKAQQGDLQGALADQSTAISLAKQEGPANAARNYFMRSDVYRSMGQTVAADQDLNRAIQLGGSRENAFLSKLSMPPTEFKKQAK